MTTRNTKREDRRALLEAGKQYHAAKLAYCYAGGSGSEYRQAQWLVCHTAECYAVGRRKASVQHGHKHYARSKRVTA